MLRRGHGVVEVGKVGEIVLVEERVGGGRVLQVGKQVLRIRLELELEDAQCTKVVVISTTFAADARLLSTQEGALGWPSRT